MNKKITALITCLLIISQLVQTTKASQYAPNVYFTKPLSDDPYLSSPSMTFSAGFANQAFNREGKLVPYLQQYGSEDFLQRFVNPSLGPDNLETAGQGLFTGQYHFKQFRFSYRQNIYHQLYFGILTTIQDLNITNITPEFVPNEYPLSDDQIIYLEKLETKIPKTIHQYGMNSMNFYAGYTEELNNFKHIDSLDVLILVAISTPQWMVNKNHTEFQYAPTANIHFGYPVIGSVQANIRENISFGFSGLVVPYQPSYTRIPINRTGENNHFLFSQVTQARIDQNPFFAGTLYFEVGHHDSAISGTIAYCYSQYLHAEVTPIDTVKFPKSHANRSILLNGNKLGAFLLQLDIDCTTKEKTVAPIVSLFFSVPVVGTLAQKTYLFGGNCNLQITYDF